MKATVLAINAGMVGHSARGDYTYMEFHYQPDSSPNYPPKKAGTQRIFENLPIYAELYKLQKGDRVELSFVQNSGGFWTIDSVSTLNDAPPSPQTTTPVQKQAQNSGGTSRDDYWNEKLQMDKKTKHSIERAVSLKCAVEIFVAVLKKGDTPDGDAIVTLAGQLDSFFQLPALLDMSEPPASPEPPEQNDGEVPYNSDEDIPF